MAVTYYNGAFTGPEIDERLRAVPNKIPKPEVNGNTGDILYVGANQVPYWGPSDAGIVYITAMTTPFQTMRSARNNGKGVVCYYNNRVYWMTWCSTAYVEFTSFENDYTYRIKCTSGNVWTTSDNNDKATNAEVLDIVEDLGDDILDATDEVLDLARQYTSQINSAASTAQSASTSAGSARIAAEAAASSANGYKNSAQTFASNAAGFSQNASTYATNAANSASAAAASAASINNAIASTGEAEVIITDYESEVA